MVDLNFNKEFQEQDALMQKRRALLFDLQKYMEGERLRQGFNKDFFDYLNEISFRMLNGGEDYYALFLGDTMREIDFNLTFPTASMLKGNKIHFLFNPLSFLFLSEREAVALIKHEILHILLKHHGRERILKNKYRKLAINLAMDISVNQYINHLPSFVERINTVNMRFDLNLKTNETLEFYTEEIHKAILEHPKEAKELSESDKANYEEVHDKWVESENEDTDEVKDKLKSTLKLASRNGIPDEVLRIVKDNLKGEVHWTQIIRKAMRTLPKGKKKTVTRVNRRQPERLDLRGELKNHIPDVTVAIDISGSIDDRSMREFLKEIITLSHAYSESIRVIECDDAVRRDYKIRSYQDIKPLLKRRGGTKFSPVFQYIRELNLRNTLLIYFTDGLGEEKLETRPSHYRTIWVVKGEKLSLRDPFGEVIYLKNTVKENEPAYGIQVMRALLHDWAR
ncbi:MAG: peptidase [Clostridia bacterium]|nr:peptidase [Clostridia bacterium]